MKSLAAARSAAGWAVALALAGLYLLGLHRSSRLLYYQSHGLLTRLVARLPGAARPDARIVLVYLDDATLTDARLPLWTTGVLHRRAHARVLRELTAAGASVVGFDVAFIDPSPDDGEFRRALDGARSVVLIAEARAATRDLSERAFLAPTPRLADSPSVRIASPLVRRNAGAAEVLGVEMEQLLPDGRTINALSFECWKAALGRDDQSASFSYKTVGTNNVAVIRWPRPVSGFAGVSYRDVWDGSWKRRDPHLFRNRIVLIGSTSTFGRADVLKTPLGALPGVTVHASALHTLLQGGWTQQQGQAVAWLVTLTAVLLPTLAVSRLRPWPALLAALAVAATVVAGSVLALWRGYWIGPWQPLLATVPFIVFGFVRRSAFFGSMLRRYAGTEAERQLVSRGRVETRTQRATVLFADVRGYTDLSETLEPSELMEVLNEHYRWLDGLVEKHGGRVDKHIGDAMMAVFEGAARGRPHAARALDAAREMVRTAGGRQGPAAGLAFGIGLHTGEVSTGELGREKAEYGSVGDAVNVAARLQQATRAAGVVVLLSEETAAETGTAGLRELEPLTLRGRSAPVAVYTLDGAGG